MPAGFYPGSHARFLLPKLLIAAIVGALALRYFYVTHQWRRSIELEARARIRALQARIRPHFLFNSMNTIASLTRSDPARAEEAVEDLADLFRASLNDARAQITLAEEIEIARTYQRIEQLRLGDGCRWTGTCQRCRPRAVVPSLLLQPLLENAIGHGIEPLPDGGTVEVRGRLERDAIVIEVTNPTVARQRAGRRRAAMAWRSTTSDSGSTSRSRAARASKSRTRTIAIRCGCGSRARGDESAGVSPAAADVDAS